MDRYKFRGKRLDNSEMVEGSLLKIWVTVGVPYDDSCDSVYEEELTYFIVKEVHTDYEFDDDMRFKVDPTTVGQYTGLKDKNGVEIYKGDILRIIYDGGGRAISISAVTYENGRYLIQERSPFALVYYKTSLGTVVDHQNYEVTKIGNIHDNKELLEG